MTPCGHLQYNSKIFPLERATFYGIYTPYGYMSWDIELIPTDELNYIMFNCLIFPDIFLPQQLGFLEASDIGDKYEHTVQVDGKDRFLDSANLRFGPWDSLAQSIQLTGFGTIDNNEPENLAQVDYKFDMNLSFTGIHLFETTKEDTEKFVELRLKNQPDIDVEIKFENVRSGLKATIAGKF